MSDWLGWIIGRLMQRRWERQAAREHEAFVEQMIARRRHAEPRRD